MERNCLECGTILKGADYTYKIEQVLGQGSFGITYLASTDVKLEGALGVLSSRMLVAIKEFFMRDINGRSEQTVTCGSQGGLYEHYRHKFAREAQNLSRLDHPNIVRVLESFEANNTVYYTMEFCQGGSLDELIAQESGLNERQALDYTRQIAAALGYMHDQKIVHLDLKPGNVMLRKNSSAVLIDFGLSKQYNEQGEPESSTTIGSGTAGYAPLEQANYHEGRELPVQMDIYALGATLFKMLTGKRPAEAAILLNDGFPAEELTAKGVSEQTTTVVRRAMSPMKRDRYNSVAEFVEALNIAPAKPTPPVSQPAETTLLDGVGTENNTPSDNPRQTPKLSPAQEPSLPTKRNIIKWLWMAGILLACISIYMWRPWIERVELSEATGSHNGYDYVDLGLSVRWATCNVGASNPSGYGDFFAWGETEPKSAYTKDNCLTFNQYLYEIHGDSKYDAARALMAGDWRIPTSEEYRELIEQCEWIWGCSGRHWGYKVVGPNGNSIFLPAAGWYGDRLHKNTETDALYWTATPAGWDSRHATALTFNSLEYRVEGGYTRHGGQPIRAVLHNTLTPADKKRLAYESKQKSYQVGDYYNDGSKEGVVFEIDSTRRHGKIVSITQSTEPLAWCSVSEESNQTIGTTEKEDGALNMRIVQSRPNWQESYPAFAWCADLGGGWYLPSYNELMAFTLHKETHTAVNNTLKRYGFRPLFAQEDNYNWCYWSSTEYIHTSNKAWYVEMVGHIYEAQKERTYCVRAVAKF